MDMYDPVIRGRQWAALLLSDLLRAMDRPDCDADTCRACIVEMFRENAGPSRWSEAERPGVQAFTYQLGEAVRLLEGRPDRPAIEAARAGFLSEV